MYLKILRILFTDVQDVSKSECNSDVLLVQMSLGLRFQEICNSCFISRRRCNSLTFAKGFLHSHTQQKTYLLCNICSIGLHNLVRFIHCIFPTPTNLDIMINHFKVAIFLSINKGKTCTAELNWKTELKCRDVTWSFAQILHNLTLIWRIIWIAWQRTANEPNV